MIQLPCQFKNSYRYFPALEKAKQSLEAENADLATELKSASAARAEGERRRKQAEAQLADLVAKLQDLERTRSHSLSL